MKRFAHHESLLLRYFTFLALMPLAVVLSFASASFADAFHYIFPGSPANSYMAIQYIRDGYDEIEGTYESELDGFYTMEFRQQRIIGQPLRTRLSIKPNESAEFKLSREERIPTILVQIESVLRRHFFADADRTRILNIFERCFLEREPSPVVILPEFQDEKKSSWHGAVSASAIVLSTTPESARFDPKRYIPMTYLTGTWVPNRFADKSAIYQKSFDHYSITVHIAKGMSIYVAFEKDHAVPEDSSIFVQNVFEAMTGYAYFVSDDVMHFACEFAEAKKKKYKNMEGGYILQGGSKGHDWYATLNNDRIFLVPIWLRVNSQNSDFMKGDLWNKRKKLNNLWLEPKWNQ